jgi:hypothetical protein
LLARVARLAPREQSFSSRLRGPAVASRVGLWLGIAFGTAFVTGLLSHYAQDPTSLLHWPTRPVWGYRVTQGLHVAAGTASIPLLAIKLWTVYPKLFAANPLRPLKAAVLNVLERGSIALLVSAGIFELATGLSNTAQWYPWAFNFRAVHFAVAWIAVGSLLVHVAVKLPVIRAALTSPIDSGDPDRAGEPGAGGSAFSRRGLARTSLLAAGVAVLASAGSAVPALRKVSVFGVRSGDGPQGIPINRSASAAGVVPTALDDAFRLTLVSGATTRELTRDDLLALPQTTARLPIACVEGWSASGTWRGPTVRSLLDLVGAPAASDVLVVSLERGGAYGVSRLPAAFASDPLTLLAIELDGETLALDHGYPCRIIAPNRPGVLQTKWVSRLEVLG